MKESWRPYKYLVLWVVLVMLLVVFDPQKSEGCVESERLGLLEIKSYLKISANVSLNWPSENNNVGKYNNCCSWDNVQCDKHGRVTKLYLGRRTGIHWPYGYNLNNNNKFLLNVTVLQHLSQLISLDISRTFFINGLIEKDGSTRLSTLKKLQYLNISGNNIQPGYFSVAALTSLKELFLKDCGLTNSSFRLEELANLKALQVLGLGSNGIHATITGGICNLKNLQKLDLRGNRFYGSDNLSCLGNLTSLKYLDLSYNNFNGMLPSIENLTSLEHLDLSYNSFKGKFSLRSSLASLSKLKYLKLSRNWLEVQTEDSQWKPSFQLHFLGLANCNLNKPSGTFPKFLLHQYNLSIIDLSYNNLMGGFPTFLLNNNTDLRELYLMNNHLTGYLQFSRHTNFSSLDVLAISGNYFCGQLPNNFGYIFPNVGYLNMSVNHFEGHIPTSVGLIRSLSFLDLANNNFSGELPRSLLGIESLEILMLSNNNLQGEIVPDYMNLPNLNWLDLSNNNFIGTIKKALKSCYSLRYLDISLNKVMGRLPKWIGHPNFSSLQSLSVSQNLLQGEIPSEICNLSKLIYLDLSQNNFTGIIPSCSNYQLLYHLHLHQNSLTGGIPIGLSNCGSLKALVLKGNKLSGTIPLWINNLHSLQFLLLGRNDMRGHIPKELCELRSINILDLSHNKFSGEIPTCIRNNCFGAYYFYISMSWQSPRTMTYEESFAFPYYPIEGEVEFLVKNQYLRYKEGNLYLVSGLDLSYNNFSGVIPSELGSLTRIYSLNLSHNFLSGPIPQNLSNLKQIESLDLSFNNLSGNIPSDLVDLNFLEAFNVSYNNLIGKVPDTGQFSTFDKNSYLGNMGLCGSTMDKPCNPENNSSIDNGGDGGEGEDGSGVLDMVEFFWSFSVTCAVIFFSTQVILYVNSRWREAWFRFVDWHILWWFPV